MALSRTGPNGAIRLTLTVEGADDLDISLSRFGEDVDDWRPFWRDALAPKFFDDVQRNFDLEGRTVGGWAPLSPAYRAWKREHFPGRRILERTLRLRRSLTWNSGMFSPGGGRGNLGPGGVYRPAPDSVDLGTEVEYASYHQNGAAARQRGLDASGRLRSRRTGRYVRKTVTARSVTSGRYLGGLPQRKFLFFTTGRSYGKVLQQWLVSRLELRGLRGNQYGTGGVAGSGEAFAS